MSIELSLYAGLLGNIKTRIRQAQVKATISANTEMILMYWDIGRMIMERQQHEGWGTGVLRRLAGDLKNELPEIKGFSERNIKLMTQFYREYPNFMTIGQQAVAQLEPELTESEKGLPAASQISSWESVQRLVAQISWAHNILLIQQVKDLPTRLWYMRQTIEQGWSRDTLGLMIKSDAHIRQGTAVTNFEKRLPSPQFDLARQLLKDPYIFDFLTKDRILAEYALRDIHKPIGVSGYELTRALPDNLKSSLPSIEEIEAELGKAEK